MRDLEEILAITAAEYRPSPRVNCRHHTCRDWLHVDVGRGSNARVSENALGIFHAPMLLQISAQRAPHHLKRDQFPWYAKSLGDGVNSPPQKVLCIPWYLFTRPQTPSKSRKHQGLG